MPFDQSTRNRLARFVGDARALLTEEFTRQLQLGYGLDPTTGEVTDLGRLTGLDDARRETARLLRDTMAHYLAGAARPGARAQREALERIVREQAFTVLNRLCALRMAEARGILIESVARGYQSKGFQLYARLAGTALGETGDAYRSYLFSVLDELALDLPVLFDRFSPQGRLFPREPALLEILKQINDPEIEALWAEDEAIGWIYQYFNSREERKAMRDGSSAPRNSRELAVRNQFFTPRYVVEFLTDNTLGRIWYEMTQGQTSLKEACRYLVRRPNEIYLGQGEQPPKQVEPQEDLSQEELLKQPVYIVYRPLKDPRDIRMLDPACGSMHFGLYAFDLYERIYEEAWDLEDERGPEGYARPTDLKPLRETYESKEALQRHVPRLIIEHNIHGIDIDRRAVQIAGLSLWLRAQRTWQAQGVKPGERPQIRRSNIVCAEPMPGDERMLRQFADCLHPRILGQLVEVIFEKMHLAGEAGSLLQIEEKLAEAIAGARQEWDASVSKAKDRRGNETLFTKTQIDEMQCGPVQPHLFDLSDLTDATFWNQAEALVLAALRDYAERASSGGDYRRHLFADDAARGFAFIDVCQKQFDVVLMNPPFGDIAVAAKSLIEDSYPLCAHDIYPAFVERGFSLLGEGGRLGAITNRTGLLLARFEPWRYHLLIRDHVLRLAADLGYGVLDEAMVETAAYLLQAGYGWSAPTLFFSLLHAANPQRASHLDSCVEGAKAGEIVPRSTFVRDLGAFDGVPTRPLAYACSTTLLRLFEEHPSLEHSGRLARVTNQTSDDFRYLRLWWEAPPDERWIPYAKGGEYSPFYADLHLVVDWDARRRTYRGYVGTSHRPDVTPASVDFFFRAGLTFSSRTNSAFSPRLLPAGGVFANKGPAIITRDPEDAYAMLGVMMSRVFQGLLELRMGAADSTSAGTPSRSYDVGILQDAPVPELTADETAALARLAREIVVALRRLDARREESHLYSHAVLFSGGGCLREAWLQGYREYLREVRGILESSLRMEEITREAYGLTEEAYREVEAYVGSHPCRYDALGPKDIETMLRRPLADIVRDCVDSGDAHRSITVKAFYADRRIEVIAHALRCSALDVVDRASSEPFPEYETLSEYAARILSSAFGVAAGRWRALVGEQPSEMDPLAPIALPPALQSVGAGQRACGMVDDEGNAYDVVGSVRRVLETVWQDAAGHIEQEACGVLGVKSLREYFRDAGRFFGDHLRRYSKSRRYAPIYWPLSTPSGSYTLWLYYHRLTGQTLYTCVNDFVEPKLHQVAEEVARLQRKRDRSGGEEKQLERSADLERGLKDFREELLRVAAFWKPNLNDGVQITAAPLWRLFRHRAWQKRLRETWQKLEAGEYDWAHLAYSIWPERVREKCRHDKSLAIAHGLEDLYEEPPAKAAKRGRRSRRGPGR